MVAVATAATYERLPVAVECLDVACRGPMFRESEDARSRIRGCLTATHDYDAFEPRSLLRVLPVKPWIADRRSWRSTARSVRA